ncbi:MAG: hypothetical protein SFZ23_00410 [Planctomycetota bacterium]|nr:hypothetical protein [Planctomycetota bacterium]
MSAGVESSEGRSLAVQGAMDETTEPPATEPVPSVPSEGVASRSVAPRPMGEDRPLTPVERVRRLATLLLHRAVELNLIAEGVATHERLVEAYRSLITSSVAAGDYGAARMYDSLAHELVRTLEQNAS